MTASPSELKPGDALIIVDVQNDFLSRRRTTH